MSEELSVFVLDLQGRMVLVSDAYTARILWTRFNSVGSVLDVACGEGFTYSVETCLLGERGEIIFPRMMNVTSLDVRCTPKIYKDVPKLESFVQGDAEHLPFRDASFDTITLTEILEHPIDPIQVLAEAKRVGRKRILITVPDEESWIKKRVWRHFSIIDSWEHVRLFNADKLRQYFEEVGLEVFRINHVLFDGFEYYVAIVDLEEKACA